MRINAFIIPTILSYSLSLFISISYPTLAITHKLHSNSHHITIAHYTIQPCAVASPTLVMRYKPHIHISVPPPPKSPPYIYHIPIRLHAHISTSLPFLCNHPAIAIHPFQMQYSPYTIFLMVYYNLRIRTFYQSFPYDRCNNIAAYPMLQRVCESIPVNPPPCYFILKRIATQTNIQYYEPQKICSCFRSALFKLPNLIQNVIPYLLRKSSASSAIFLHSLPSPYLSSFPFPHLQQHNPQNAITTQFPH